MSARGVTWRSPRFRLRPKEVAAAALPDAPVVSVWMPTYAHESYIAQAIESALVQEAPFAYEIVIGEDASPDRTRQIVLDYQRRYPDRIKVLLQRRNVGPPANALDTLRACRGRYIAMLEGDDYWTDARKLESQVELLEANPSAFLCGARAEVRADGRDTPTRVLPEGDVTDLGARELFTGRWWFRTSTKMVPRRLLLAVPTRFDRDYAWMMWLIAHTGFGPVCFLDRVVAVYREHSGGAWTSLTHGRRVARDVGTLADLAPWFEGADRRDLEELMVSHVETLTAMPDVPGSIRLRANALALLRCPGRSGLWRSLGRSLVSRRPDIA